METSETVRINSASLLEAAHARNIGTPTLAKVTGLDRSRLVRGLSDPHFFLGREAAQTIANHLEVELSVLERETLYFLVSPAGLVDIGSFLIGCDTPKIAKAAIENLAAAGVDTDTYGSMAVPVVYLLNLLVEISDPRIAAAAVCRNPSTQDLRALIVLDAAMRGELDTDPLDTAITLDTSFGLSRIVTRQAQRVAYLHENNPGEARTLLVADALVKIAALHLLLLDELVKPVLEATASPEASLEA